MATPSELQRCRGFTLSHMDCVVARVYGTSTGTTRGVSLRPRSSSTTFCIFLCRVSGRRRQQMSVEMERFKQTATSIDFELKNFAERNKSLAEK